MKYLLRLSVLIFSFISFSSMFLQKTTHIVFFGDSITEAGAKPGGFITMMKDSLQKKGFSDQYELTGEGIGGNKVYDLYLRLENDVLAQNPDVVVIWVGVNDVWHKTLAGTGTDADKFEKFYLAIIKKLQDKNIKVILCTPATIGEKFDYTNQQDGDLNKYSQIVRDLAKNNHCGLLDFRDIFHLYDMQHNPSNKDRGVLTVDGVHLNEKGNQLVANKMMEILFTK